MEETTTPQAPVAPEVTPETPVAPTPEAPASEEGAQAPAAEPETA